MIAQGGGGRLKIDDWVTKTSNEAFLCRVTRIFYQDSTHLWPDEDGELSYGFRIGFEVIAERQNLPYAALPLSVNELLQTSSTKQGRGFIAMVDPIKELLDVFGVSDSLERTPAIAEPTGSLADVVSTFAAALRDSNIDYGARHQELVRRFVASLAIKRFLILTGLSGSGKTRLAQAFGEWLGTEQSTVIAVRPDWTSPDYLLGYENELAQTVRGRKVWSVPETLAFVLQAAANPEHPHLLILDEMNLAHVGRYFADVLSGIESGKPVIPNLEEIDGSWVQSEERSLIRLPGNLFVAGTVNVDETTYMFSPKVLDRANTIEFRVETTDLGRTTSRPTTVQAGPPGLVARFQVDSELNLTTDPSSEIARWIRTIHGRLADSGREFGHRAYTEVLEFAHHYLEAGGESTLTAFDVQVCQKVLPRLHGSKRDIGPVLGQLLDLCHAGPSAAESADFDMKQADPALAKLPVSYNKLKTDGRAS